MKHPTLLAVVGFALLAASPAAAAEARGAAPAARRATAVPAPVFRVSLAEDGVYRVSYEDLMAAGLEARSLPSRTLGLFNRGKAVPVWVRDGGDGRLGAGDWIEFVGQALPGETSHYNEHTNLNVYMLRADVARPARMRSALRPPAAGAAGQAALSGKLHLEQDLLLLRLAGQASKHEELWYWAKLSQIDPEPFRQTLDLSDLDVGSDRPVKLSVDLRGWSQPVSKPVPGMTDHKVVLSVAGRPMGIAEWNNHEGSKLVELPPIPAGALQAGPVEISVAVPPRASGQGTDSLVDVVVVNWIEAEYPRLGRIQTGQTRLYPEGNAPIRLRATTADAIILYGDDGIRVDQAGQLRSEPDVYQRLVSIAPVKAKRVDVVVGGQLRPVRSVVLDRPSRLASKGRRADYIMVTHERLRGAIEPLASFYRQRGMAVEVVDIQDVYDEFNHGILHPRALKDFLSYAYHSWRPPAPRFVLLVGDASWDAKNEQHNEEQYPAAAYSPSHGTLFSGIPAATYYGAGTELTHRNLIPTWSYLTYDGHAAGDNWFVSVDGDDELPDMAVGRFPVTEASDVAAIIEKTVRYQAQPEYGPWRSRMLWVTSEQAGFMQMSDQLADTFTQRGFEADKVYPPPEESGVAHDQERLREALDRGPLMVHFVGHGGRYIWRTGPPDWQKHRDLFNLEDIDKLKPSARMPVVVSMTCYSAPFDHPSADSIGEKFLRVAGKGAVAVIAASWRNAPYRAMSEDIYRALTEGGDTLGEAIQKVKRKNLHHEFLEQYNLLGDPALVVATPRLRIEVEPATTTASAGPPSVRARISAASFKGRAVVDWLDAKGALADRQVVDLDGPKFTATLKAAPGWDVPPAASVRVYAWDAATGVDASGQASLSSASASLPAGGTP